VKRRPPAPREGPTAFDRVAFVVCEHENKRPCMCKRSNTRCCVALENVTEKILETIRGQAGRG
jgi:hypothetical protein